MGVSGRPISGARSPSTRARFDGRLLSSSSSWSWSRSLLPPPPPPPPYGWVLSEPDPASSPPRTRGAAGGREGYWSSSEPELDEPESLELDQFSPPPCRARLRERRPWPSLPLPLPLPLRLLLGPSMALRLTRCRARPSLAAPPPPPPPPPPPAEADLTAAAATSCGGGCTTAAAGIIGWNSHASSGKYVEWLGSGPRAALAFFSLASASAAFGDDRSPSSSRSSSRASRSARSMPPPPPPRRWPRLLRLDPARRRDMTTSLLFSCGRLTKHSTRERCEVWTGDGDHESRPTQAQHRWGFFAARRDATPNTASDRTGTAHIYVHITTTVKGRTFGRPAGQQISWKSTRV